VDAALGERTQKLIGVALALDDGDDMHGMAGRRCNRVEVGSGVDTGQFLT